MQKLVLISLGGVLGTLARYLASTWIDERARSSFPFGTLAVNFAGCFAAGFLYQLFEQVVVEPQLRLALVTGFLGAFTTFSAYALQTFVLERNGWTAMAVLNVAISNIMGLLLVWIGVATARRAI